jgi:hypothetical protein
MKWLNNIIKNALKEYIKENDVKFVDSAIEHVVLSKEDVNVLAIDCGQMPMGKAREYLERLSKQISQMSPDYKIVLISKMRS